MKCPLPVSATMRGKSSTVFLETMLLLLVFEARGHPQQPIAVGSLKEFDDPGVIGAAPVCERKTFCEIIPHYPVDVVSDALKKNRHLQGYSNSDEIDMIAEDMPDEEPLCVSTEQVVYPKAGLTKTAGWKYIVNHENLTQSIRIETCLEEDKPCRVIEGFATGYVTKCKQKYIYRQLLAVGMDGSIYNEFFRFPASCCCHIEFQGDKFLNSYGSDD
ncbi:spaetzle domain-containing protein isoform X2 [Andrena cerasifolii]|uniref:spaetzle domain-containing protein isoform X2 n=1 Tax=Andrena cerasifolii TaxID=2819439 RepID=UPI0040384C98